MLNATALLAVVINCLPLWAWNWYIMRQFQKLSHEVEEMKKERRTIRNGN